MNAQEWFRLADKFTVGDGCWDWTAAKDRKGYGQFRSGGQMRNPHRVLFQVLRGSIPAGLQLDHLCRNPLCVRPSHLETVSQTVNVLRGVGPTAINARREVCASGHPFDLRRPDGGRGCKRCAAMYSRRYQANKKVPV